MQINQLRYILAISEHGSLSKAAKALFVSQPSLSQQVLALENELNVGLFVRHTKGVSLTDAGEEFVVYARRILNEMQNLEDSMGSYASLTKGRVKVGMLWIFSDLGLAEMLSRFRVTFPEIKTHITVDGSLKLLRMLDNREVDCVFCISTEGALQDESLYYKKLYESDMVMVINKNHSLAQQEQLHLSDLNEENIVLPAKDSSIYGPLIGYFHSFGVTPNIIAQNSQTDVQIACAENNMAIAFVSDSIAKKRVGPNSVIRPFTPVIKREVFFVVRKDALVIPAVRLLTEFI